MRTLRRSPTRWIAAGALALVVASCGGDAFTPRAARELSGTYELLVAAVDAGDRSDARRLLQDLIRSVDELRAGGEIEGDRADAIIGAATEVSSALRSLPAPIPSPTTSASLYPSEPSDPEEDGDGGDEDGSPGNSEGNGKGKAKGHDKD